MKCIRCGKDCNYPERSDGRCPHCRGLFALEPRRTNTLTDGFFQGAVKAVSADGKVRWNLENLYYEVCRRHKKPGIDSTCGCGCVTAAGLGLFSGPMVDSAPEFAALAAGIAAIGAVSNHLSKTYSVPKLFSRETFNKEWSRWADVHGTPPSLIVPAPRSRAGQLPALESDLTDYSFDRAVICDHSQTVDLLVANNFHFENNCAVLSVDGYPPQAFDAVRKMLKTNPRLKVWVLHDATPGGCTLAQKLRNDPDWFDDGATLIDVGMRPRNATALKNLWQKAQPSAQDLDHPSLTAQERSWLTKYQLSLAAIRPEQVIKRLFRSVTSSDSDWDSSGGGSGFIFIDSTSFSSDASTSDGGGDSFG